MVATTVFGASGERRGWGRGTAGAGMVGADLAYREVIIFLNGIFSFVLSPLGFIPMFL